MYKPGRYVRKKKLLQLFSSPEQQKCSKGCDAGPAHSCASLPSAARMLAALYKQRDLGYSGKLLHFDSRIQLVYIYPARKERFVGQGNHCTTNHALPRTVLISSPCIHVQKANKCQLLTEKVVFLQRIRKDDQAVHRTSFGNICTCSGPLHRGKNIFIFHHLGFSRNSPGFVYPSSIMNKGEDECAKFSSHIHSGLASSGQYRMIIRCPVFMCMWTEQACNGVVTRADKISLLQSNLSAHIYISVSGSLCGYFLLKLFWRARSSFVFGKQLYNNFSN